MDKKSEAGVKPGMTSIVILAHNRWDQTELCLRSIEQHTPEPHEIILLDNGSTDETKERLRELVRIQDSGGQGFKDSRICRGVSQCAPTFEPSTPRLLESSNPVFRVISNEANRGFAAGCNQGLAEARGEYVLLLNNDTIVTPGWLGSMVEIFQRYPKTGIAGPMSNSVTRPQLVENIDYAKSGGIDEFARKWAKTHEGRNFATTKASGFCLLAKREVIDTIGGLDERFGSGNFEDDDFCTRALLAGFEIRIAQDVFIHHEGRQTFETAGLDYDAQMARNWKLYKAKWGIPEDAGMDNYWAPTRLSRAVDLFVPLPQTPDLSPVNKLQRDPTGQEGPGAAGDRGKIIIKERRQMGEKEKGGGFTSIIVLISDHREYTRRCVESILSKTEGPYEIVLVPRDPAYAPPKWLRRIMKQRPNCRVVTPHHPEAPGSQSVIPVEATPRGDPHRTRPSRKLSELNNPLYPPFLRGNSEGFPPGANDKRMSYAQACNLGIRESSGKYLAVLSDAVLVTPEWLSGLIECLNSSDDTGIVGPMTANIDGPQGITRRGVLQYAPTAAVKPSNPRTLESSNPDEIDAFAKTFRERNRYRRVHTNNLDSACLLFRRGLTEKIGLFDEGFKTDGSTVDDYCLRAALEESRSVIAADVFVGQTSGAKTDKQREPVFSVAADKGAFSRKWGNFDDPGLISKEMFGLNSLFLADELSQKGQREMAAVTLIEAIKKDPADRRLHYALAQAFMEDKKFSDALGLLEKMPAGIGPDRDARKLELIGYYKEAMGLDEEADRCADEILALDEASARAWTLKGAIAFKKGLTSDAEKYFARALESDRGFGEVYSNLGALQWIAGNKEKAFNLFEKGFILSPTIGDIVTNYYTAAVSLSKLPEAAATFQDAVSLHPFNRRLKFILIDNLLQQGKFPEAMNALEEAMVAFGVDDDTLSLAVNLRDRVGPMEIGERQKSSGEVVESSKEKELRGQGASEKNSRGQGAKGSSGSTPSNPRILESLNPSVSLCMIVKNEEANIVRSLMAAKPLVDEIIVVDTGSIDRTTKIAAAFGAKVFDFKWTDSFSDARNYSLSKAAGDWILVLDADEVISSADFEKLKALTGSLSPLAAGKRIGSIAYSFITRNYVGPICANWRPNDGKYKEETASGWFPSEKVRLFPNDSRIRFENPVHEVVEDSLSKAGYAIKNSDIPVHHYGKLNKEEIKLKGEEYYLLGKKKLAEQGDRNPDALYELAVQALELERYEESLGFWEKLLIERPTLSKAHYGMGTSYYNLGRFEEARKAYKAAIDNGPDSRDPFVMYTTCEFLTGNAELAASLLEGFLEKDPLYPLALLAAVAANLCAGDKKTAFEHVKKLEQTQFGLAPYLNDISKLLISVQRFGYALALLEAAVETDNTTFETHSLAEECHRKLEQAPAASSSQLQSVSQSHDSISLCMIVKNEEDTIKKALASARPLVDEIIVVDTGSVDRTKDIAQDMGAKVYDFTWNDSFSDARNFSLSKASGKWIFVLDADEVISPLDHEKIRALIGHSGKEISRDSLKNNRSKSVPADVGRSSVSPAVAFSFITRNYVDTMGAVGWIANEGRYLSEEAGSGWFSSEKVRLFPNNAGIRFERRVHEVVEDSLTRLGILVKKCDVPIHHYGKLDFEKTRAKGEEYYELGKKKFAEMGQKDSKALFELALQASELGKYEEALSYWRALTELKPNFASTYYYMGLTYYEMGRYDDALSCLRNSLRINPAFTDALITCSKYEIVAGNAENSVALLSKLLKYFPSDPKALATLATALFCLDRKVDGSVYLNKLKTMRYSCAAYFSEIAGALISVHRLHCAANLLEATIEYGDTSDEIRHMLEECRNLLAGSTGLPPAGSSAQQTAGTEETLKKKLLTPPGTDTSISEPAPGTFEGSNSGTISLCMIVKNEEVNIKRALLSVKSIVDEMIVVDTGSTDRTREIAKSIGAQVHDFQWTDSFAEARNFSLSKASGDWILILDADEVISPADCERLKSLTMTNVGFSPSARTGLDVAYLFTTRNYVSNVCAGWQANDGLYSEEAGIGWFPSDKVRLFPNHPLTRFSNSVHELVEESLEDAGMQIRVSSIPIHHYGKLDPERTESRRQLYYDLMQSKLKEKGVADEKALFEVAVLAAELQRYDEAAVWWQRLIAINPSASSAYHGLGNAFFNMASYGEAVSSFRKALEVDPGLNDSVLMLAISELCSGNAFVSLSLLESLPERESEHPFARLTLAAALFCIGESRKGQEHILELNASHVDHVAFFADLARRLISSKRYDYAMFILTSVAESKKTPEIRELVEACRKLLTHTARHHSAIDPVRTGPHELSAAASGNMELSNPAVSLCMIVKDEEDTLERALMSVKPVVDEMIVVDTGSKDRTRDIARALGAKVYDFKWTDSFSDARNFSLSKASGKWILVLDADEVISQLDYGKLRELVTPPCPPFGKGGDGGVIAYSFVTRTYVTQLNTAGWVGNEGQYPDEETGSGWFPGEKVRLFPNDPRFRFEYPLHERIEPSLIKAGAEIRECDIPMHHYGNFVTKEKAASKAGQYYQLGKKKLAEYGEQNFMAFYELALLGAEAGRHEEALEHLKKVITLKPDFPKAHQSAGNAYYNLGRYEEALSSYKKALQLDPASRDALLMCATCEILTGNAEQSVSLLEEFLATEPSHPRALLLLAEACFCIGTKEKGLVFARKLKNMRINTEETFIQFARILVSAGRHEYALSLLKSTFEPNDMSSEVRDLLARLSIG